MADLEEALGNILADPQAMEQILSLASKLGLEDQGQDQEAGQEDGGLEQAGPAVPCWARTSWASWGSSSPCCGRGPIPRSTPCSPPCAPI